LTVGGDGGYSTTEARSMTNNHAWALVPSLPEEARVLLAAAELVASEQAWEAAQVLVTQRLHRDALSRAYFGLWHAVRALLLREGYDARGPNEVLEILSLRFAGPGELPSEAPAVLARAQRYGELCDFGVGWVVTPERVLAELEIYEEHRSGLLAMLARRGIVLPPSRD
jgi:uncharacterized protein (UPF0332 family)